MPVTAVVGGQWGDEGKGRVVDLLGQESDFIIRFNGGANAGHTVVNDLGTFKMHLMPCGIFNPRATVVIANGVMLDLEVLQTELKDVTAAGVDVENRFLISPRCHVVMPYHKLLDGLFEEAKGPKSIGTTLRGIGPSFADKVSYNGIRLADMANETVFRDKLETQVLLKNKLIEALGGAALDVEEILATYRELYSTVEPFVCEPFDIIHGALAAGRKILLEGAQGAMLDTDWSAYPFCTAASPLAGAAAIGAGIPPNKIDHIICVVKAYSTRVGNGPMPTELHGEEGDALREAGQEYGATTGRPRRCGWFDAEVVRFTAALNGATELALTRLDVLDDLETIQVSPGYQLDGEAVRYVECDARLLERCEPVLEEHAGWQSPTGDVRAFDDLPAAAQSYVERLEELVGVPFRVISVGPEREQRFTRA
ncbi:MAG: adenylosuccinate synthase [Armatimonadota bacterium]